MEEFEILKKKTNKEDEKSFYFRAFALVGNFSLCSNNGAGKKCDNK